MEIIHNKLVRDNIPNIIENDGKQPIYHVLSDENFWTCLLEKDIEELEEVKVASSPDEIKKEIADKLEILIAMAEFHGFSLQDIIDASNKKRIKNGGFKNKLFLEKVIIN